MRCLVPKCQLNKLTLMFGLRWNGPTKLGNSWPIRPKRWRKRLKSCANSSQTATTQPDDTAH